MLNNILPEKGKFLISEPFMQDPNFKRAVVLLTEHGPLGSMGYILNQPLVHLNLKDIISELGDMDIPIYYGGPVANDTLHYIHRCADQLPGGSLIADNVFWGGDYEVLKNLINTKTLRLADIRFFLGYSGWESDQLEAELQENTWMVGHMNNSALVFSENHELIWREAVVDLGEKYAHVSQFPTDPSLN